MATAISPHLRGSFLDFLHSELAPRPGRLGDVLRIVVLTVLVVATSETFRIPLPAYSAYIVFFASKEETASTTLTGVVLILASAVAVLSALLVYMVSAGEFAVRLPLMAIVTFAGLFFSRVSPLGPAAFVIGFVVTVALTLIDIVPPTAPLPSAEILTQTVLWLWVVIVLPVGLVVVANLLTGRDPNELFRRGLAWRLQAAGRLFCGEETADASVRARLTHSIRAGTVDLLRYLKMSAVFHKPSRRQLAAYQALVARAHEVVTLSNEWMALGVAAPSLAARAAACGQFLSSLGDSLERRAPIPAADSLPNVDEESWGEDGRALVILQRLTDILAVMPGLLAEHSAADSEHVGESPAEPAKRRLLIEDAFSNPEHLQFALKTTLCVVLAYIAYNLLDWPEIRTAMITCFFVTLGNVGETFHKMTLRIAGALIGGGLGLATIVFLMPYLTSITDLCLVIAAVSFLAAWIGTGSEKLSYAGLQIAMAFFFSVLVGYGPTVNLAMAKDRVVGILVGNVIVWLVFSHIWPISAATQARNALASALRTLAAALRQRGAATGELPGQADAAVFAFDNALAQTWRLLSFDPFEPEAVKDEEGPLINARDADSVQSLFGPAVLLAGDWPRRRLGEEEGRLAEQVSDYWTRLSGWLSRLGELVAAGRPAAYAENPPDVSALAQGLDQVSVGPRSGWFRAQAGWYRELGERTRYIDKLVRTKLAPSADDAPEAKGAEA